MSDKKQNFVSASELSRRAGVTKQTISRKIKNKILLPVSHTDSGRPLFDLDSALKILADLKPFDDEKYNQSLLLNRGGRPKQNNDDLLFSQKDDEINGEDATVRFNNARAARAEYQAMLAKLEVEERYKTVVSVESVRQQGSELGSVLVEMSHRNHLLTNDYPGATNQNQSLSKIPNFCRISIIIKFNSVVNNLWIFRGSSNPANSSDRRSGKLVSALTTTEPSSEPC